MKTKETVKPEHVSIKFDEEWKVLEKGYELRVVNLGKQQVYLEFSPSPLSLEKRMLLSSGDTEGISYMRAL